jgi:hypothetical protein
MKLLFGSFWRAVAYCLHPKVLALSLLPLLVAGLVTLGLGKLYWEDAVAGVRATLEHWSLVNSMLEWIAAMLGADFRTGVAALIVVALSIPVEVALTLALVGIWVTPAVVAMVGRRRFPALERRHGGSWLGGLLLSIGYSAAALFMVLVSVPFWLIPGVALVVPPLIWGWLNERIMGFDVLAEHASTAERDAIRRAHRGPMLVIGIVCGFLCGVPSLIWTISIKMIILAPIIMPGVLWLYTMIFTFSALWFAHYTLPVLATLRSAEAAMRAVQPSMAPPSDLQLVDEVPPHERFGFDAGLPDAGEKA